MRGRVFARHEHHRPGGRSGGEFYPDGQPRPKLAVSAKFDQQLLDEAVDNARHSDLVVAVVGDVVQLVGETCSTATLELLGGQNAMLEALATWPARPASRWSWC